MMEMVLLMKYFQILMEMELQIVMSLKYVMD